MERSADLNEMMAEEYDRIQMLDAAFDMVSQLRESDGAMRVILDQAREDAHRAVHKLIRCDPYKVEEVRELQWQVKRFDDLCLYVKRTLEIGNIAARDLSDEQIAETARLLRGDDEADIED